MNVLIEEPHGQEKIDDLKCICGSSAVFYCISEVNGLPLNQLYCPNCGIVMRSPATDENGAWLKEHWKKTVMRYIPDKPKMTVNDFLRKFRKVEHGMNVTRPRVLCADGFTVSVQAGYGLYSTPNCDADAYTHVELGYPSRKEEALMEYAANRKQPTETIYGSVPAELVDKTLEAHGDITGADFSNDLAGKWEDEKNAEHDD